MPKVMMLPITFLLLFTLSSHLEYSNSQNSVADAAVDISELLNQAATEKLNALRQTSKPVKSEQMFVNRRFIHKEIPPVPRGVDLRRLPFRLPQNRANSSADARRCQFTNGTLWASATECDDELDPGACASIFGRGEPRPEACLSDELADLAKRCARTCRLCCETPKFNCVDSGAQLVDCAAHRAKCKEGAWRRIMMSICEHTCGFCSADKCFDLAPDCHSLRALCFNRPMSPMFRQQCPLTCGLCQPVQQKQTDGNEADENVGKAPRELIVLVRKKNGQRQKCEDLSSSCGDNEHLCNDENYRTLLRDKCAKTCGHCTEEEQNEEETLDSIQRIRHSKQFARDRPPVRNRAGQKDNASRKQRPVIVIDNRKMIVRNGRRRIAKMKMDMEVKPTSTNGGRIQKQVLHISRELLADQGEQLPTALGMMSPIVILFGASSLDSGIVRKNADGGRSNHRDNVEADRKEGKFPRQQNISGGEEIANEDDNSGSDRDENEWIGSNKIGKDDSPKAESPKQPKQRLEDGMVREINETVDIVEELQQNGNGHGETSVEVQGQMIGQILAMKPTSMLEGKAKIISDQNKNRISTQFGEDGKNASKDFDENTKAEARRISERILDILKGITGKNDDATGKRRKRDAKTEEEAQEQIVEDLLLRHDWLLSGKKRRIKEVADGREVAVPKTTNQNSAIRPKLLGKLEESEEQLEKTEQEQEANIESEEANQEADEFKAILRLLSEKLSQNEHFMEEEDDNEDEGNSREEEYDDQDYEDEEEGSIVLEQSESGEDEIAEKIFTVSEDQSKPLLLEEDEKLEEDKQLEEEAKLAQAGLLPLLKSVGQQDLTSAEKPTPRIIRVRIQRPGANRKGKKEGEQPTDDSKLLSFDGILRDRQGKALPIEAMKGGIGGALAEVRRRYGLGNWTSEEMAKVMLETSQGIRTDLREILAELHSQNDLNNRKEADMKRKRRDDFQAGKDDGDDDEEQDNEDELRGIDQQTGTTKKESKLKKQLKASNENDQKRVPQVLRQLLQIVDKKNNQQKEPKTKIPEISAENENEDDDKTETLLELLRRQMTANLPSNKEQSRELLRKSKPSMLPPKFQLISLVALPANAGRRTSPAQFVFPNQQSALRSSGPIVLLRNQQGQTVAQPQQPQEPQVMVAANGPPMQPQFIVQPSPPQIQPQPQFIPQSQFGPAPPSPTQFQPPSQVIPPAQPQSPPQQLPAQLLFQPQPQQPPQSQFVFQPPSQPPQPLPQPSFQPPLAVQSPQTVSVQQPVVRPQRQLLVVQPRFARGGAFGILRTPLAQQQQSNNAFNVVAPRELCRDYYPYCEQIVPHGFCNSEFYPLRMKREFCPQSCNLC